MKKSGCLEEKTPSLSKGTAMFQTKSKLTETQLAFLPPTPSSSHLYFLRTKSIKWRPSQMTHTNSSEQEMFISVPLIIPWEGKENGLHILQKPWQPRGSPRELVKVQTRVDFELRMEVNGEFHFSIFFPSSSFMMFSLLNAFLYDKINVDLPHSRPSKDILSLDLKQKFHRIPRRLLAEENKILFHCWESQLNQEHSKICIILGTQVVRELGES